MYEKFERLCKEKNVTAYKVSKATGVSTATLTNWKKGRYTPKPDKIAKIADYFGVNVNYFYDDEQQQSHFVDEEAEQIAEDMARRPELKTLFMTSKNVPADDLKVVQDMIDTLAKKQNGDVDE